ILRQGAHPQLRSRMRAPKRQLVAFLAGWIAVLVENINVAPAQPRIGQQAARWQRHEQRAAEVIVAEYESEPACRGDPAGYVPGAQCGIPQSIAKLSRPWVRLAPRVDDAARLGVIEVNTVAQRHRRARADGAEKLQAQRGYLADLPLWLGDRARV